jgi:hypothetical protein
MSDPQQPEPEPAPSAPSQEGASPRDADLVTSGGETAADDPHPVTDRYVARRLAADAAARAEREQQEGESLVGEPPTQGAFLFYLLLGLLISLLLLAVIFRTGEASRAIPHGASPPARFAR